MSEQLKVWWTDGTDHIDNCMDDTEENLRASGFFEVVEKSAYDALAERLRECEAALKFYAHPINWDCQSDAETNNAIRDCDLSIPEGLCDPRGGKRAREYFKKWGEK